MIDASTTMRRYTFKLYPNRAQVAALREQARLCAVMWNALLEITRDAAIDAGGAWRRLDARSVNRWDIDDALHAIDLRSPLVEVNRRARRLYSPDDRALRASLLKRLRARVNEERRRVARRQPSAFDLGHELTRLYAQAPEWRALKRGHAERLAGDLGNSWKAFFSAVKKGERAGPPRFRPVHNAAGAVVADAIAMREPGASSWRFTERQKFTLGKPGADGPCGAGPRRISSSAESESHAVSTGCAGAPADAGGNGGERGVVKHHDAIAYPADAGGNGGNWSLRMPGVPGAIKARGQFPIPPSAYKTADVRFHDDAWWFSICVAMPARRDRGAEPIRVAFNLIDEFASVTDASGQCVPGLNDPFSTGGKGESHPHDKGLPEGPGGNPVDVGERRKMCRRSIAPPPVGTP